MSIVSVNAMSLRVSLFIGIVPANANMLRWNTKHSSKKTVGGQRKQKGDGPGWVGDGSLLFSVDNFLCFLCFLG
jgi:hypothetical protein